MEKWYFTFSCDIDDPHRNGYHVIETPSALVARALMMERFGKKWAFQYSEKEFEGQIEKYNLHEVQ
jgi:hypothetical protein